MPPPYPALIKVRKKAWEYQFCHEGCPQLETSSTCFSCEKISIPMYTFPRRLHDTNSPFSPADLTFQDLLTLDYNGYHEKVLLQEDGWARFTACSYGFCLKLDVKNLVACFLFQLGAESSDKEGLCVRYVRYVNGPRVMFIILATNRGTYDLRRAMLEALGRDRKRLLPTRPASRAQLQSDDTTLKPLRLANDLKGKLEHACRSLDTSMLQDVMGKCSDDCSSQCHFCGGEAALSSPCCSQFVCGPCFMEWRQIASRCYGCRQNFGEWLEYSLDWNVVPWYLRKYDINTSMDEGGL